MKRVVTNTLKELQDLVREDPDVDNEDKSQLAKIVGNSLSVVAWSIRERLKQSLLYYTPYAPAMFEHQSVIQSLRINHPRIERREDYARMRIQSAKDKVIGI